MSYNFNNIEEQITPLQARELAMKVNRDDKEIGKCIIHANACIKNRAKSGYYDASFDTSNLTRRQYNIIRKYFKTLGYKVSFLRYNDGWIGSYAYISWG